MVSIRMALDPQTDDGSPVSLVDKLNGLLGFSMAVLLLRLVPLRATLAAARAVKRVAFRRGTIADAERAIVARDWAARFFPGRAACLELSLAAFLSAAFRLRAVDWCIGCRFGPCESHAWIQAENLAVGEPDLPDHPFRITVRV